MASVTRSKGKVLLVKPGLDPHDRGLKTIAKALMDAGFEVVYLGLFQSSPQIVAAAIQECVDIIGLSFHSSTHLEITREIINILKEKGGENIKLIVGGIISKDDAQYLKKMGVLEVFGPGTLMKQIIAGMGRVMELQKVNEQRTRP